MEDILEVNFDDAGLKALFQDIATKIEAAVGPIAQECQGRPADEIKPKLDEALRAAGLENVDSTEIAQQISRSETVRGAQHDLRPGPVRPVVDHDVETPGFRRLVHLSSVPPRSADGDIAAGRNTGP